MPKSIIAEGKTKNEAIENGLKELKVGKKDVDIKVLENEEKRTFFSILAPRVVKVELTLKEEEPTENKEITKIKKEAKVFSEEELEKAKENITTFLNEFLPKTCENASFEVSKSEKGIDVNIKGEDSGFLIGYRGECLYALQNILYSIASKGMDKRVSVLLDIADYKQKREKTLENLADKLEKTVIRTRKSVTLEPMKAYERKIIHTRLQNSKKVKTASIGEEPKRKVVISLK